MNDEAWGSVMCLSILVVVASHIPASLVLNSASLFPYIIELLSSKSL